MDSSHLPKSRVNSVSQPGASCDPFELLFTSSGCNLDTRLHLTSSLVLVSGPSFLFINMTMLAHRLFLELLDPLFSGNERLFYLLFTESGYKGAMVATYKQNKLTKSLVQISSKVNL